MKQVLLAGMLLGLLAAPATAYTTYLKPSEHWPQQAPISVEGSHTNRFFTPEIAVPAQIDITGPDGAPASFDSMAVQGAGTLLQADLFRGGTYRFSTGEQVGAPTTLVGVDGQWRPLAQGETPPEGAPLTTIQTVTLAETYVTRGTATRTVVDTPRGRLAIKPMTHPNQVLAAGGFEVQLLFDGAPIANTAIVLYAEGDADNDIDTFAATDANGVARFSFAAPGRYVIAARHRAPLPAGGAAAIGSYTTTLTFEALAALPQEFRVGSEAEDERPRRRRFRE
ncbi:MAG: DUF4198 domain-containing protein [Hyphomonadaceae bacterium]|nr:DUF4198 domain-containing protein [Hyphomonadaceae bacterium]